MALFAFGWNPCLIPAVWVKSEGFVWHKFSSLPILGCEIGTPAILQRGHLVCASDTAYIRELSDV